MTDTKHNQKVKCDCEDFKQNMPIIEGMIRTCAVMSWGNKSGYEGKKFQFCPWCSKALVEDYS